MKYFLSIPIMLYQTFFPKKYRGECLFRESCSNYVLRITNEKGFVEGIKALNFRYKNCRPGYTILSKDDKVIMITVKHIVFNEDDIDLRIINKTKK